MHLPEYYVPNLEALQANDGLVRDIIMHMDRALLSPSSSYAGHPDTPGDWHAVAGMRSAQHAENTRQLAGEIIGEVREIQAQHAAAFPETASSVEPAYSQAVYVNRLERRSSRPGAPTFSVRQLGVVSMAGVTTHEYADAFRFDWMVGGELGSLAVVTLAEKPVYAEYALVPDETEYVLGCMELFGEPMAVDKILSGDFKDEAELAQLAATLTVPEGAEEILAGMKARGLRTRENKLLSAAHNLAMPGTREFEEVRERLRGLYPAG
jgi:hypothetical protein